MQSQVWAVPLLFLLKLTIVQTTLSEWRKLYAWTNIALCPPRLFKYLQLIHAIWSSPWFPPSTHPLLSLVDAILGQLLSCSSSLRNIRRGLQKLSRCLYCSWHLVWLCSGALLESLPALVGFTALKIGKFSGDLIADMEVAKARQQECPWMATLLGQ